MQQQTTQVLRGERLQPRGIPSVSQPCAYKPWNVSWPRLLSLSNIESKVRLNPQQHACPFLMEDGKSHARQTLTDLFGGEQISILCCKHPPRRTNTQQLVLVAISSQPCVTKPAKQLACESCQACEVFETVVDAWGSEFKTHGTSAVIMAMRSTLLPSENMQNLRLTRSSSPLSRMNTRVEDRHPS